MKTQLKLALLMAAGALSFSAASANALTVAECSAKYKAAKAANTLAGKSWNDFRKSECATDAAAETKPADTKPAADAKAAKPAPAPAKPAAAAAGGAVFPTAIAAQFAKESAFKARLHTCSAQYKTNKATNSNGGLKWIQKGGGYWSECNKHLKG